MKKILILGEERDSPYLRYIEDSLKREISAVGFSEITQQLGKKPDDNEVLIVDPFPFSGDSTSQEYLQNYLKRIRSEYHLPVIVFTSHLENSVMEQFGLKPKVHYDAYVGKLDERPFNGLLREALERLVHS